MMEPNELRDAREALIRSWIGILRGAGKHQREKTLAALKSSEGKSIKPPPLELHGVSRDMFKLMIRAMTRALHGKDDPFDIAPRRASVPRLSRQKRIYMVMEIIHADESGHAKNTTAAINEVAGRYAVSFETARKAYYDKDLNGLARIHLETAYRHNKAD